MKSALILAALLGGTQAGSATTTTLSIIINSAPSTNVTCAMGTYTAPLAAGSTICPIVVVPASWSGAITLSGTSASSFAIQGANLVVGSTALAAGNYSVTLTATP